MNFTDISCFLNKLKIKQTILEKHGCDFAKSIDENYGIVLDANNIISKSQNEHQMFSLKREVQENQKILQELKGIVSPHNIPKIDLLALKQKMLTLENSIQTIKNRIALDMESLTKEEHVLTIDVTNIEIKYSDVNKNKFEQRKSAFPSIGRKAGNPVSYQEVEDFTNFLIDNGGHEGGWSQNDHLLFVKYFLQIKSRKMLLHVLLKYFPDFSEEKISNHIEWYTAYLSLREKQKKALEEWRQSKAKKSKSADVNALSGSDEKKNNIHRVQKQDVKEKISKWKLEKQQKLQQDNENRLKAEYERRNKWKNEKKMKREMKNEMKHDVGQWRASKQAQEKAEKLEMEMMSLKEKEQKIMLANALIREFQKQDSLYIMRRINKHSRRISSLNPPREKEGQKKFRDPERIFKATRQWLSRISSSESNENIGSSCTNTLFNKGPLNVQQIPKLRIPTWRLPVN